jgi:hypothetical protein
MLKDDLALPIVGNLLDSANRPLHIVDVEDGNHASGLTCSTIEYSSSLSGTGSNVFFYMKLGHTPCSHAASSYPEMDVRA